jgi:hypothetical protein
VPNEDESEDYIPEIYSDEFEEPDSEFDMDEYLRYREQIIKEESEPMEFIGMQKSNTEEEKKSN